MKIKNRKNITLEELRELENILNVKIPPLFFKFLLDNGQISLDPEIGIYFTLDGFTSIFPFDCFFTFQEIIDHYKYTDPDSDLLSYLPLSEFLIIGQGHGQNYFAVGIDESNLDLIFWYDDELLELIKAADNFEEFVKNNFREGY